jgi:hypothetical protein
MTICLIVTQTFHDIINKNVKMILTIVDKNSNVSHTFFITRIYLMTTIGLKVWFSAPRSIPGIWPLPALAVYGDMSGKAGAL